ncbi:MAG: hypothetical protein KGN32_11675 [Burkholderiales bacterium]|nr:hypothetical protein [Burkholderiales bacterium]
MEFWRFARLMVLWLVIWVAGCAMVNDKALRLFSSKVPAYAIVNKQLLHGEMVLLPDRTGNLALAGGQGAISNCSGQVLYEATTGGTVDLHCNEGTALTMRYSLLSETRGYAYGAAAGGAPASLTFGLPPAQAVAYLTVPAGKKLLVNGGDSLELQ